MSIINIPLSVVPPERGLVEKWHYIKGAEKDFVNAQEWTTIVCKTSKWSNSISLCNPFFITGDIVGLRIPELDKIPLPQAIMFDYCRYADGYPWYRWKPVKVLGPLAWGLMDGLPACINWEDYKFTNVEQPK